MVLGLHPPTHSPRMSWRYHYPQSPFPTQDLVDVNRNWSRHQPEYESDPRHRGVRRRPATGSSRSRTPRRHPTDILMPGRRRATTAPTSATLPRPADALVPQHLALGRIAPTSPALAPGRRRGDGPPPAASTGYRLEAAPGPGGAPERPLLRERDRTPRASTAARTPRRTRRTASTTTSSTARRRSTRRRRGTKAAVVVPPAACPAGRRTVRRRLRLPPSRRLRSRTARPGWQPPEAAADWAGSLFSRTALERRAREAD